MPEANEAPGIPERKWPQQDSVHHAENGGVRANPQSQRDDRNRREPGALAKLTHGITDILK